MRNMLITALFIILVIGLFNGIFLVEGGIKSSIQEKGSSANTQIENITP